MTLVAPLAHAVVTPTWSANWLSAPNSQGTLAAAATVGNRQILAGTRTMDSSVFVSAHALDTGELLWSRSLVSSGPAGKVIAVQARANGDGFYVAGQRTASIDYLTVYVARFDLDGTMLWVSDLSDGDDYESVHIADAGGATVVSYSGSNANVDRRHDYLLQLNGADGHIERRETSLEGTVGRIVGAPSGALFMTSGQRITRYDVATWQAGWSVDVLASYGWTIHEIALAPDGDLLVSGNVGAENMPDYHALIAKIAALDGQVRWVTQDPTVVPYAGSQRIVAAAGGVTVSYDTPTEVRAFRADATTGAASFNGVVVAEPCYTVASDVAGAAIVLRCDHSGGFDVARVDAITGMLSWRSDSLLGDQYPQLFGAGAGRVFAAVNDRFHYPDTVTKIRGFFADSASGGNRVDLPGTLRNPVLGSLVAEDSTHSIAVGATLEDDGPVLRTRRSLDATGQVLWENTESYGHDWLTQFSAPDVAIGGDGSVVVGESAVNIAPSDQRWSATVIASYDRASGNRRWAHPTLGSVTFYCGSLPTLRAIALAPDGSPYLTRTDEIVSCPGGPTGRTAYLERLDPASGNPVWSKTLGQPFDGSSPPASFIATNAGVVTFLDPTAGYGTDFALRSASNGDVVWARPQVAYFLSANLAIAPDGDLVAAYTANAQPRNFVVDKIGLADGALRWRTTFGNERDYARAIVFASDGSILAGGRSADASQINYPFVLKLASNDGHIIWQSAIGLVRGLGFATDTLRETAGGEVVFDAASTQSAVKSTDYYDYCALCQNHAVRLDGNTGAVLGWQHLGAQASGGAAGGDHYTYFGGFDASQALMLFNTQALPAEPDTLAVERVAWPTFVPGSVQTSIAIHAIDLGAVARWGVSARVTNTGASPLHGVIVDVLAPLYATFSGVDCSIEGAGACGPRTTLRHVRQTVDLEPGATAVVGGELSFVFSLLDSTGVGVSAELPFEIAGGTPQSAQASLPVTDAIFAGSFE